MSSRSQLLLLGTVVLVLEALVLTPLAVVADWPAQFGGVGTDAGAEFLSRGTAVSAPLAPLTVLGAGLLLLRAARRRAAVVAGAVLCGLVALAMLVASLGEALADGTHDVPKAVLVLSGAAGLALTLPMLGLAASTVAEARHVATAPAAA